MLRPKCTRRRKDGRPCQREAADWPGQWQGYGLPALEWPDHDRAVACWTHLTEAERRQCLHDRTAPQPLLEAARAESRAQVEAEQERRIAERRAAGLPDHPPPPEEPRCTGGPCISEQRAYPGQDLADSASARCNTCGANVCVSCGRTPVDGHFTICDGCAESIEVGIELLEPQGAPADYNPPLGLRPDLRRDLHRLAGQIVRASGLDHPTVQKRLNKSMGVWRRDQASPDQLQRGIDAAEAWLGQLQQPAAPQPPSRQEADRVRLKTELTSWAAERGLTLAEVAALASDQQPPAYKHP
ncbi:hypothetical protein [Spirillospora sp. CA-128828]|uniref:hypothetical protein n=1 Tax=Spirillospora sp. CA-128828 TaxID=3240033 RepID=UPI003D950A89